MTHPNVGKLREFLDAYGNNDAERIRAALSDDAIWHVGGTHSFSGDYQGEAILEYFGRVGSETAGTLRLVPIEILANDQRGAAFLRVTADRKGQHIDVTMAEAFEFDDHGRIREFWAHANDQEAINKFWSREGR